MSRLQDCRGRTSIRGTDVVGLAQHDTSESVLPVGIEDALNDSLEQIRKRFTHLQYLELTPSSTVAISWIPARINVLTVFEATDLWTSGENWEKSPSPANTTCWARTQ